MQLLFRLEEEKMKKFFALALTLAMTLSLAACGAKEQAPAASAPAYSAPNTPNFQQIGTDDDLPF